MKLLGWMHRKQRQNDNVADLTIGHPLLEDKQNYMKHTYGSKPVRQTYKDYDLRKSFGGLEAVTIEENYDEDLSAAESEIFHGFLAIGTLGSDTAFYPSTPTFTTSFESLTAKENEVSETELKLISDELEKALAAEAMEDDCNFSSGRNSIVSNGRSSHVSNGRSSHGSTITLSGQPLGSTHSTGNANAICPLQGYLFGLALEEPQTTTPKEHRPSLGELFQRSKAAEVYYKEKCEKSGKREADKSAIQLMKKILRKTKLRVSSKNTNTSPGGTVDITYTETNKLPKILHMFKRKVHPENVPSAQNSSEIKTKFKDMVCDNGEHMLLEDKNITITPYTGRKEKNMTGPNQSTNNENGECWIKTDADFLVLEL